MVMSEPDLLINVVANGRTEWCTVPFWVTVSTCLLGFLLLPMPPLLIHNAAGRGILYTCLSCHSFVHNLPMHFPVHSESKLRPSGPGRQASYRAVGPCSLCSGCRLPCCSTIHTKNTHPPHPTPATPTGPSHWRFPLLWMHIFHLAYSLTTFRSWLTVTYFWLLYLKEHPHSLPRTLYSYFCLFSL